MRRALLILSLMAAAGPCLRAGNETDAFVHFDRKLQIWDGFGVNYVEVAQTRDYKNNPQEYGGFSTLSEQKRGEILDLIFGPDGLKPGLAKMFLDPYHQGLDRPAERFDHETTTKWMRYFIREGLKRNRARGADLSIITTLYGPPAWATKQKFVRGRDLDPARKEDLVAYLIDWLKYTREVENFPVNYISLHNEGEDIARWPTDGSWAGYAKHDFNMHWPALQVADFLRFMRPMLDRAGLKRVGIAPGETSSWDRFSLWGYAWGIQNDPEALASLGLIASHGFGAAPVQTSIGTDLLRLKRPELHAWTTSMSWGQMDAAFVDVIRMQIYNVKVNGVIPWAAVQTNTWVGGDPNPGTAFRVDRKGGYTVEPGYYFYKQVSRAGQPGMTVASVESGHPDVRLIAFASNGGASPDAFVIFNVGTGGRDMVIRVTGTPATRFQARITGRSYLYEDAGVYSLRNGAIECTVGPGEVITFTALDR